MKIQKVAVRALRDNVYYASIWIQAGGQTHEIDARPSDAITLALLRNGSIFVTSETLEQVASEGGLLAVGRESQLEEFHSKAIGEGRAEPEALE